MSGWLSSWLVSPALMWAGLAAISIPIIIHLLNRRRFKIVDWAAMSFLLDADKKNRRRVRIENLLLLLLRCLAMLLIGLILARPFLDPQMLQGVLANPKVERIVVIDDSLSMQLQTGNETSLGRSASEIERLLQRFVGGNTDDSLTVFVASRPDEPIFSNEPITGDTLDALGGRIKEIKPTDTIARFDQVLQTVDRYVHSEKQNVNRAVYVFSDFREHDWRRPGDEENPNAPNQLIRSISELTSDCLLVDVGTSHESNVTITSIVPEETLIEGVANQFHVEVANQSNQELNNIRVRLRVGETLPLERTVESIGAGKSEVVSFDYVFTTDESDDALAFDTTTRFENNVTPHFVQAEVVGDVGGQDQLLADSTAFFAARVIRGIPVLIVDGDSSSDPERSESHYLARALSPPGEMFSGVMVDVKTDIEFESIPISNYRVIFLCNVREISDDRLKLLEEWVRNGGGLVLMPGDQVVAETFNEKFFAKGQGLSPIKLVDIRGDVDEQTWSFFEVDEAPHPVFRIFEGQDNPFLNSVKIFSWWGTDVVDVAAEDANTDNGEGEETAETVAGDDGAAAAVQDGEDADKGSGEEADAAADIVRSAPMVMLRLNDPENTAAVVERGIGKGRVVAFAIPADRQWTDWPDNPSYVIAVQELTSYAAGNLVEDTVREVGTAIQLPIDLAEYQRTAKLTDPAGDSFNLDAVPLDESAPPEEQVLWEIEYGETNRQGFYDIELTRNDGSTQRVVFATNVSPREGNLKRFRLDEAGRGFFGENARFVSGDDVIAETGNSNQSELWFFLLFVLGGVLMLEQLLGWWFGRKRRIA